MDPSSFRLRLAYPPTSSSEYRIEKNLLYFADHSLKSRRVPQLTSDDLTAIVDDTNYDPHNPPPPPLLPSYKKQTDGTVGYGPPPSFHFEGHLVVREEPREESALGGFGSVGADGGDQLIGVAYGGVHESSAIDGAAAEAVEGGQVGGEVLADAPCDAEGQGEHLHYLSWALIVFISPS